MYINIRINLEISKLFHDYYKFINLYFPISRDFILHNPGKKGVLLYPFVRTKKLNSLIINIKFLKHLFHPDEMK